MAKYVFEGPKDAHQATVAIDMLDGRVAGVGQEIELSDEEAERLEQTVNLRKASDTQSSKNDSENETLKAKE